MNTEFLTPWLNLGVSGAFLAIAWVIVTQHVPGAFARILQEFAAQRNEFLETLRQERDLREADRNSFLESLKQQRVSADTHLATIQRLEAKLEAAMVQLTTQMTHLAGAVNLLLKKEEGR